MHNKLPVKERLFRIQVEADPYCEYCLVSTGAEICDVEHFFCSCSRVAETWRRLKSIVVYLLEVGDADVSDWDLINLHLPNIRNSNEAVWLLGSYVREVWRSLHVKGRAVLKDTEFFGFLKFKYKNDQHGARVPLSQIPGLG